MEMRWEFDFSACHDGQGAAKAFVDRLDGTGVRNENGPEVELWAFCDPDDPAKVVAGNHDVNLTAEELTDLLRGHLLQVEGECGRL
jgi:hypothetical protein